MDTWTKRRGACETCGLTVTLEWTRESTWLVPLHVQNDTGCVCPATGSFQVIDLPSADLEPHAYASCGTCGRTVPLVLPKVADAVGALTRMMPIHLRSSSAGDTCPASGYDLQLASTTITHAKPDATPAPPAPPVPPGHTYSTETALDMAKRNRAEILAREAATADARESAADEPAPGPDGTPRATPYAPTTPPFVPPTKSRIPTPRPGDSVQVVYGSATRGEVPRVAIVLTGDAGAAPLRPSVYVLPDARGEPPAGSHQGFPRGVLKDIAHAGSPDVWAPNDWRWFWPRAPETL